jgi:short-subunit dehydrogenase
MKKIVVTGSSRGIGLAIAKEINNSHPDSLLELSGRADSLSLSLSNSNYTKVDLTNHSNLDEYCKYLSKSNINILINNAGVGIFKPFKVLTDEDFFTTINTNLFANFKLTQAVIPYMEEIGKGLIINISSVAVQENFKQSSIYAASKAAQSKMFAVLREEVRSKGIGIVNIYPGATATDIWDVDFKNSRQNEMMQPSDIATVVANAIHLFYNTGAVIEDIILKPQTGNL